jgi:eukaryotic-like serine/threonine-protein kinase
MLACPECRKLFHDDASVCPTHRRALVRLEELPDEEALLEPGTMVGEYQVERRLGSGTFGEVYAGEQPLIGKKVAIKVLHRKFASNAGVVSRFVAEARAVNRIRHRNIIDIFSFGRIGEEQPYFVMELLDGITLGQLLDRDRRVSLADALPILRGIADGLDAAHEAGVTHRDLKPDNIFLAFEKEGRYFPKLLDFGVAKLLDEELAHKTATGAAIGTPSYMAPEQCRGRPIDHRADVYALGVVIHEMLTGRRLFDADSGMDVLIKHVSETPPSMSSVCPELPEALDAPVLAMLAKRPNDRPSSAGAAVTKLIERARAIGAFVEEAPATPAASSDPAAPREAATRKDVPPRAEDVPTVPKIRPSQETKGSTEPSSPVVISVDPGVTGPDDESSRARTMLAASSPASGTLLSAAPPSAAVRPSVPEATLNDDGGPPPAVPHAPDRRSALAARPSRAWPYVAALAAVAAAVVFLQRSQGSKPPAEDAPLPQASPAITATAAPTRVTIRLTVTPPDADVIVDGLRAGSAGDPLVLPRSEQSHSIRIEKAGYEAQTLDVTPDRDLDRGPIALRALPAPARTSPASPPAQRPAPSAGDHPDIDRPSQLKPPR